MSIVQKSYANHTIKEITKGDLERKIYYKAKEDELAALYRRGTRNVIRKDTVCNDANILGGRVIVAIKNKDTKNKGRKTNFVF